MNSAIPTQKYRGSDSSCFAGCRLLKCCPKFMRIVCDLERNDRHSGMAKRMRTGVTAQGRHRRFQTARAIRKGRELTACPAAVGILEWAIAPRARSP